VLDADEALRTGLVSRVVDDPRSVADAIASGEPDALHVIKRRIRDRAEDAGGARGGDRVRRPRAYIRRRIAERREVSRVGRRM